ncbi:Hypothetical predicted protein [Pelobates cultripes]|uniref:Transposase n=1 Tax=Pelobates cultripes TaxID=61616 RepID=A0AAD1S2F3_PELCU|nr:Hypothetical predicted protein [Pelobates cultripes]
MGKTKRLLTPGPSQTGSPSRTAGPMDGYLGTPRDTRAHQAAAKMAPSSPDASSTDSPAKGPAREESLTQIAADLATISANMMSRADNTELLAEIRAVIREEVMEVRRDLTALERRVEELEAERAQIIQHRQATDTATTRQGNVLLELRRNLEDLDNRGRRNNIRVRGLPESAGEALPELLLGLFTHILGDRAPADFGIERAHRALRPVTAEGPPRDVICYLLSYSLKDEIMKEARSRARALQGLGSVGAARTATRNNGLRRPGERRLVHPPTAALPSIHTLILTQKPHHSETDHRTAPPGSPRRSTLRKQKLTHRWVCTYTPILGP